MKVFNPINGAEVKHSNFLFIPKINSMQIALLISESALPPFTNLLLFLQNLMATADTSLCSTTI